MENKEVKTTKGTKRAKRKIGNCNLCNTRFVETKKEDKYCSPLCRKNYKILWDIL